MTAAGPANPPDVTLRHVSGVSWPRSGHHLLQRLLTGYFGPRFVYCEFHKGHPTDTSLGACCRQMPCAHADRVTLTKNHDFHFEVPQIPGHRYLVQTRAFVPSVVSNFELAVKEGLDDTQDAFCTFASRMFASHRAFVQKWVASEFAQSADVLHLPYEDLTSDPEAVLALAIRHLAPDHGPDPARMRKVIAEVDAHRVANRTKTVEEKAGVRDTRKVEAFRHHTPALFAQIDRIRLSRGEVEQVFQRLLGRKPAEANMLAFQGFETRKALAAHLRATPEFATRHAATPAATPPEKEL